MRRNLENRKNRKNRKNRRDRDDDNERSFVNSSSLLHKLITTHRQITLLKSISNDKICIWESFKSSKKESIFSRSSFMMKDMLTDVMKCSWSADKQFRLFESLDYVTEVIDLNTEL